MPSKISFPHMGPNTQIFRWFMQELGWEVIMPEKPNSETLSLGAKYSPEFFCVPFKICLGTFIDVLNRGAEVIATSGGVGPCRAGHYHMVEADILRRQGYRFDMIVLEPIGRRPFYFLKCVHQLNRARHPIWRFARILRTGLTKIRVLDELETELQRLRPRELRRGTAEAAYDQAVALVVEAPATLPAVAAAKEAALEIMRSVPVDREKPVLRVGLVGEIYVLLEPKANLEIEKMLGELGVEVHRDMYLSGWTAENAVTAIEGTKPKVAAAPYLGELIGGHGQESIGNSVLFGKKQFDGLIQLAPFTCVPEIVARGILPAVSRDLNLPFLSFFLDEQTGEAGMRTRVEAFVDMLWQRRRQKEGIVPCHEAI